MNKQLEQQYLTDRRARIAELLHDDYQSSSEQERQHYFGGKRSAFLDPQVFFQRYPKMYLFLAALLSPTVRINEWKKFIREEPRAWVANLGCGTQNFGSDVLHVDFVGFEHVDVVADLNQPLPIKDNCLDGAVCISVIEHLKEPEVLFAEAARTLKPGAKLYLAFPFLYPFHGAPSDYYRWTTEGIRCRLMEHFDDIEVGPRGGPVGVGILTLSHIAAQTFSFGSERMYRLLTQIVMTCCFPFKYLDHIFCRLPFGSMLCTSLYAVATKRS